MKKFLILLGVVALLFLAVYAFRNPIGNGLIAAGERSNVEGLKIPLIKAGLWFTTSFQQGVEKNLSKVGDTINDPVVREETVTKTKNLFTTIKDFVLVVWKDPLILVGVLVVFLLFMLIFAKGTLGKWAKSLFRPRNLAFTGIAVAAYLLSTDLPRNAESLAPVIATSVIIAGLAIFLGGPVMQLFGDLFQNAFNVIVPVFGVILLILAGLGAISGWYQIDTLTSFVNNLANGAGFWHGLGKIAAGTYNLGNSFTLQRPLTTNGVVAMSLIIICAMYFINQKVKGNNGGVR